jgi:hypothetical protein
MLERDTHKLKEALQIAEFDRLEFYDLVLVRKTFYETDGYKGQTVEICRQAFSSPSGEKFVYSGKNLGIAEGDIIHLRATVRQVRDKYGFTRLTRPFAIEKDAVLL